MSSELDYDPSSFSHFSEYINGIKMHFVMETPKRSSLVGGVSATTTTLVLCHGWPDLWYGWRKVIKPLARAGYRVIVPTLRGFGETDAPTSPESYGFDTITTDMAKLLDHVGVKNAIFVGHDWGGAVIWRMCLYYPDRVVGVVSFCTPYFPPLPMYIPLEEVVRMRPQFQYQLYFNTEQAVVELEKDPEFVLKALFRGCKQKGNVALPQDLIYMKNGPPLLQGVPRDIDIHPMLSKNELDYYVKTFSKSGFRGGLNYYRTRKVNWETEKQLLEKFKLETPHVQQPALMVLAEKDSALPPSLAKGMESYVPNLSTVTVNNANHWILQDYPSLVVNILLEWLKKQNFTTTTTTTATHNRTSKL